MFFSGEDRLAACPTVMEVTIERILPGGFGLAHADGRTIMVALAAPGDHVRVRIDRVKGNVSFASIEEILTAGADRVEPPCPYFGRCGGCDFQQLNYGAQLSAKTEIIKDCLRRLARIEDLPDFHVTPASEPWHYRSRAQWQYDAVRQHLGYFESGSRNVCDVVDCAVLVPQLQQTLVSLREQMKSGGLPETRDFRAVVGDNETISISPPFPGPSPTVREGSESQDEPPGVREISRSIHGESYRLNAESFFQANDALVPQLIDAALGDAKGTTAIEFYSGVGLFTLPLARRFAHVIGVESEVEATKFARESLSAAGITNVEVSTRDVGVWLDEVRRHDLSRLTETSARALQGQIDLILLDPPRAGAESRVIAGVLGLRPARISYVSCDPATLARDLKKLIAGGYRLDSLAAFDMFPQTHHVETVAQLIVDQG